MPKKILLVEDEGIIIELLEKRLRKEGYEVVVGRDGLEGLEKMRQVKPDLVLLDIVMPRMNGFAVLEEMNKDPQLKRVPVIIISNSGQPTELDRAQRLGAQDWLIKTEFDLEAIAAKVAKQMISFPPQAMG